MCALQLLDEKMRRMRCETESSKTLYELNENSHTLNIDYIRIFPYICAHKMFEFVCAVSENTRERCIWWKKRRRRSGFELKVHFQS